MDELGFDFTDAVAWFPHEQDLPFALVKVSTQNAQQLAALMSVPLRRCYITDDLLAEASAMRNLTQRDVLRSKLPDPGSTMSGDFAEVLGYFYQSVRELPGTTYGVKKWRLKQDRTKPAPKSDVVHFVMPNRPLASDADAVLCSEVKAKATQGSKNPIPEAIRDCEKDRVSRLASTLVWLRERAATEDLGDIDLPLLNRFIDAVEAPPASRRYRAVAVVCESLLEASLVAAPAETNPEYSLVVVAVPQLQQIYTDVFAAAQASVD